MMSQPPGLRFEAKCPKTQLLRYLKDQKKSAAQSDDFDDLLKSSRQHFLQLKMSEWYDNANELAARKQARQNSLDLKTELKNANHSITTIRRAALEKVLEKDHKVYSEELEQQGKAFYVKYL